MERTPFHRCDIMAKAIGDIFKKGLVLNESVVHFIESTFCFSTFQELEALLIDDGNCEKEALIELIFFPDESIQIQLEDVIGGYEFEEKDVERISTHPVLQQLKVDFFFPDRVGKITVAASSFILHQFVARLNLTRKLDPRIAGILSQRAAEQEALFCLSSRIKVRLRNTRCMDAEHSIRSLCVFFQNMDPADVDFPACLDFLLDTLGEGGVPEYLLQTLIRKKRSLWQHLQKVNQFENMLKTSNIETLMLQRYQVPCLSGDELHRGIQLADKICLAVFGTTYPVDPNETGDAVVNFSAGRDADEIIKALS